MVMTNIPKSFQDYDDDDPNRKQRNKRWDYWASLKLIRKEYIAISSDGQFDAYDFEDYIEKQYGIKMNLGDGNITDGYTIMDEKKYLLFLLKFN